IEDDRFSKAQYDPRFLKPKKNDNKVKIDNRFKAMLKNDKEFGDRAKVDQYGRKVKSTVKQDLSKFYELEDDEESSEEEVDEGKRKADILARSRGELVDESSSEEDDGEDYDLEMINDGDDTTDEEYEEAEDDSTMNATEDIPYGDETKRFACVNMDWDNVKSKDLYMAFNSIKPPGGSIISVTVYPSEFGKECIEKENQQGPPKEIFQSGKSNEEEEKSEDEDEEEFDQQALRLYQLNKLKYYFAVVECDSVKTAKHIYDEVDTKELESTANFFDLRFIPDEMEFTDPPRDVTKSDPTSYKPVDFITDVLTRSKVKLTWEDDDPDRVKLTRRKFTQDEIEDQDFSALLGSDSEEDEKEDLKQKYRALLNFAKSQKEEEEGSDEEMEITFTPGLSKSKAEDNLPVKEDPKASAKPANETTIEAYMRKQREKRMAKASAKNAKIEAKKAAEPVKTKAELKAEERQHKAELELLLAEEDGEAKREHFDLKEVMKSEKKNKKKKKQELTEIQDNFEIDTQDPRFSAIHESHMFAIDPTNPNFKKTKAMDALIKERRNRSVNNNSSE
ncbi:hypothetical protein CONCODRAFT_32445, partial [Conidiobolus coronatus NRRL 28638]